MTAERVGKASREIKNKNSQIWTMYLMKRTLTRTDFGVTFSVWKITPMKRGICSHDEIKN